MMAKRLQLRAHGTISLILGLLAVTLPAYAEDEANRRDSTKQLAASIAEAKTTVGQGQPAMWTLGDEDTTIYLFGSFHLLKPNLDWRSDKMNAAFADAHTVVFEADAISPAGQAKISRLLPELGFYTDGTTLLGVLDDADESVISDAAEKLGLPLAGMNNMKPWLVSVFMSQTQSTAAGFDPSAGVEAVLTAEAQQAGKTLGYLETVEEQFSALSAGTLEDQIDGLVAGAAAVDYGVEAVTTLADEWVDGDVAGLAALVAAPDALGSQAAYEALLVNRNRNWVPQIEAMLDTPGTTFIAVGAGHLVGDDSVVAMLRANGYQLDGPDSP